nr:MAG TPA: Protein of unknown function (DUF1642) [Caudoviricetes sp.]
MNKQEFQQTIKNMKPPKFFTAITLGGAYEAGFEEAKGNALYNSCFINEPEKPVVPRCVADWIEWCKRNSVTLLGGIRSIDEFGLAICNDKKVKSLDASKWATQNQETFAQAWLFGYKIKKEKLYTVELPNPNRADVSLALGLYNDGKVAIFAVLTDSWKYEKRYKLTESEIKQDFDWAWQFAKEVEE